jgi:hypothetical protein
LCQVSDIPAPCVASSSPSDSQGMRLTAERLVALILISFNGRSRSQQPPRCARARAAKRNEPTSSPLHFG